MAKKKNSSNSGSTSSGRIDVRSRADIPKFENLLTKGPMAVVLVYADWCGHCMNFKKNVWNNETLSKPSKLNAAAVHYNMVEDTTMKNANISGYPSMFLVGKDKKPEPINTPKNSEELVNMLNTTPKSNNNSGNKNNASSNVSADVDDMNVNTNADENMSAEIVNENSSNTALPPNSTEDVLNETSTAQRGGGCGMPTGLYDGLLNVARQAAPAALLVGAAALRGGRRSRRNRRRALKKSTRRNRK